MPHPEPAPSDAPSDKSFVRLMVLYVLYNAATLLLGSLFELYFFTLGLNIPQIILTSAGLFLAPLLIILFLARRFPPKNCILASLVVLIIASALLALFPNPITPFVARFLAGLPIFLFWVPFNIRYYEFSRKNNALLGSVYYSVNPVLSLALPFLAGWIAATFGFPTVFLASIAVLAVTLVVANAGGFMDEKSYGADPVASFRSIDGLRTLFFIEGFSINSIVPVTLSAMILLYYRDPLSFGGLLSAVTLFSVAASLVTARLSDHFGERRTFLIASAFGFLLAAVAVNLADSASLFFLAFGAINFFRSILLPLPLALAVDNSKNLTETMVGREIMLNLGRLAAVLIGFLLTLFVGIRAMLLLQTLAAAVYIPIFELKKKKLNSI